MPASSRIKIQILLKIKTTSLSTMLPIVYKSIWDQVLNLKLRILTCPSEWTNSFKNYYYYDNFIFNSFHFENRNSCSKILNMHQFRALGVHNTNIFNQINSIYLQPLGPLSPTFQQWWCIISYLNSFWRSGTGKRGRRHEQLLDEGEKIQGRYNKLPYLDSNSVVAFNFTPSPHPSPQKTSN